MMRVKPKTQSNVNWAVSAYNRWRNERLNNMEYDYGIYNADLNCPERLEKMNLIHALCYFIPEITKVSGEAYPGKTLYQIVVSIQKYLETKKIYWRLVEDRDFRDVRTVLDNVMKERALMNLGLVSRTADIITYEMEQDLWNKHLLRGDTPDKLRTTCYFYLGLRFCLRSVQDHYGLRRTTNLEKSQLSLKNVQGKRVLCYVEDAVTKTHDGGLKDRKHDRKRGALFESDNADRDPVRLVQKYLDLCPTFTMKSNFYLQSLKKPTPTQWYGQQVLGEKSIGKIIPDLMESAGVKGYFTGHSLRRSGGSRLFQAGVDRKLVMETTGHTSDAVDKYQITSDDQRQKISNILSNKPGSAKTGPDSLTSVKCDALKPQVVIEKESSASINPTGTATVNIDENLSKCSCATSNVGNMVDSIIGQATSKGGKTTIKIQIEICKE